MKRKTIQEIKNNEANMIDKTNLEAEGIQAALKPLAEYITEIGIDKPISQYSKEQILFMIEVIITSYQDFLLSDDLPF